MRSTHRRRGRGQTVALRLGMAAGLVATVAAAAGCSPAPSAPDKAASVATDTPLCQSYARAARSARTPIDAMHTEAVLAPFVALIELSTRQAAQQASTASDPMVAGAMREVVASLDDLDAQGKARLPAGADLSQTPVRLDPARLASALDAADRACARFGSPTPGG